MWNYYKYLRHWICFWIVKYQIFHLQLGFIWQFSTKFLFQVFNSVLAHFWICCTVSTVVSFCLAVKTHNWITLKTYQLHELLTVCQDDKVGQNIILIISNNNKINGPYMWYYNTPPLHTHNKCNQTQTSKSGSFLR